MSSHRMKKGAGGIDVHTVPYDVLTYSLVQCSQSSQVTHGNQASTDESNQDKIVEPDTNLEGFDSVRIHSLLEECIVMESNQSRLV